ncbi:hypothetical protein AB0G73_10770 [Streptomyces sp. NPDC020719]|uniref:hypothetical protein n=1 Tax=Streptomyces sp. NPDC020719 TaxID=3154896 RepID=UPI0033F87764
MIIDVVISPRCVTYIFAASVGYGGKGGYVERSYANGRRRRVWTDESGRTLLVDWERTDKAAQ